MRKTDPSLTEEQKEKNRIRAKRYQQEIRSRDQYSFKKINTDYAKRTCLNCDKKFKSPSNAHRRCPKCEELLFGR